MSGSAAILIVLLVAGIFLGRRNGSHSPHRSLPGPTLHGHSPALAYDIFANKLERCTKAVLIP